PASPVGLAKMTECPPFTNLRPVFPCCSKPKLMNSDLIRSVSAFRQKAIDRIRQLPADSVLPCGRRMTDDGQQVAMLGNEPSPCVVSVIERQRPAIGSSLRKV